MTNELRTNLAMSILGDRMFLMMKYPGPWTMTTDLKLLPEAIDINLRPYHAYGFTPSTTDLEVNMKYIRTGLFLIEKHLGKIAFLQKVNQYIWNKQGTLG